MSDSTIAVVRAKSEFTNETYAIKVDYSRDKALPDSTKTSFKEDRYMLAHENSPQEALARASAAYASNAEHAQRLYDYSSKMWFMFASPVLASAGNPRGQPVSCFLTKVGDSREDLADAWREMLWLATEGGGVGSDYSDIRSVGQKTSRGTSTPGLISFLGVPDAITKTSIQGEVRRGASAIFIDISHPEIVEFIECRKVGGDANRKLFNIHNAVNIPDAFMTAVEQGTPWELKDPHSGKTIKTVDARELWDRLITTRVETGEPYIHFQDTSNRFLPEALKAKGLFVHGSNLCVAPETLLFTEYGHQPICELQDQHVTVWNGINWSSGTVRKTGENKELIRVTFSDGSTIDCTPEHKFYVQKTYQGSPVETPANALCTGDKMEKFDLPTTGFQHRLVELLYAYDFGFYCGDGNTDYEFSWIYKPKESVIPHLTKGAVAVDFDINGRARWAHGKWLHPKFTVPFEYSLKSKLDFLAGYFDADGCVIQSDNCQNLQVTGVNYKFLHEIKLMLQTMGVPASLSLRRKEGNYPLPSHQEDVSREYYCQEIWLLGINGKGIKRLLELGIVFHRLAFNEQQLPNRDASKFITVLSVEHTGRISDTFCLTEPERHKVVFNGILTGQCSEILLPTARDRTAVCVLSSVNLEYFDAWSQEDLFISDLIEMLDNVLSVFINKAPDDLAKAVFSASRERSIGLGAMGFHLYLQKRGVPFESAMASSINRRIFKYIYDNALTANYRLGRERGEAPDLTSNLTFTLDNGEVLEIPSSSFVYSSRGSVRAFELGVGEVLEKPSRGSWEVSPSGVIVEKSGGHSHTGRRLSHMIALAPNASSAILCGNTSPSIEPFDSNIFVQKKGRFAFVITNKELDRVLKEKYNLSGKQLDAAWEAILHDEGSVQNLPFMEDSDKAVFKTARELDQAWLIDHAAQRQEFICQGQSLNLFVDGTAKMSYLRALHKAAWKKGLKTLYYLRAKNVGSHSGTTGKGLIDPLTTCVSCEG